MKKDTIIECIMDFSERTWLLLSIPLGIILFFFFAYCRVSDFDGLWRESPYSGYREYHHCLDPNTGIHAGFHALVQAQLYDPDNSMVVHKTRLGAGEGRKHTIVMVYEAKNELGIVAAAEARGEIDAETCRATLISAK